MAQGSIAWMQRFEEQAGEDGYFEPLGSRHCALFHDDGPVLLVSFENRRDIDAEERAAQTPRGVRIARDSGWSALSIVCDGETWFRDPAVYAYFDRLVDEAFFEDFDHVVFYGARSCGYAAAAFSVAAPGATLIALQPQATLDPALAIWDTRFRQMRRVSFSDRYGFAPEMLEGIGTAFVLYDPFQTLDSMHAALYKRPGVTLLPCRNLGENIEWMLREMDILDEMITAACRDELTEPAFWQLFRARRNLPRYLRHINMRLSDQERPYLEALVCRNVALRLHGPRFRNRFQKLEAELTAAGITLPAPLPMETT